MLISNPIFLRFFRVGGGSGQTSAYKHPSGRGFPPLTHSLMEVVKV